MKNQPILTALLIASTALFDLSFPNSAQGSAPELSVLAGSTTDFNISISNLVAGATYYIEYADNLISNDWNEVHSFEGIPGSTNWSAKTASSGFYRAVKDPYHAQVGKVADFGTGNPYQVSGTAEIFNNRTIKISNFNYTGGGVAVEIVISDDSNYYTSIPLTEDIFGQSFVNETLILPLPAGIDLNTINYISVWCFAAGADFGSGPFQ